MVLNEDLTVRGCNLHFGELMASVGVQHVLGRSVTDFLPQASQHKLRQSLAQLKPAQVLESELVLSGPLGKQLDVQAILQHVQDGGARCIQVRVRPASLLRYAGSESAGDERLRLLMQITTEGIVIHENGIITDVNQALLNLLGYAVDQVVGHSVFDFTHPDEHASIRYVLQHNLDYLGVRLIKDRQGNYRPMEISSRPVTFRGRMLRVLTLRDLSELHRIRAEEQRLLAILEASPLMIFQFNDQHLLYLNRQGVTALGYGVQQDLIQAACDKLFASEFQSTLRTEVIPEAQRSGRWEGQAILRHSNGRRIFVSMTLLAHRGDSGAVDFYSALCLDISEEVLAWQQVRENQERLKYFMEQSHEAIIIHHQGHILDFNDAAIAMFGYEPSELNSLNVLQLLQTELAPQLREQLLDLPEADAEALGVRADGSTFELQLRSRHRKYKGSMVHVLSLLDISSFKRTEHQLLRSQAMLQAATQASRMGIWEWNLVTNMVTINEVLRELAGLPHTVNELAFSSLFDLIAERGVKEFLVSIRQHLAGETPMLHHILRTRKLKGQVYVLEIKGHLMRDANNMPVQVIGTAQDITERYRMEEALRKSEALLSAVLQTRQEPIWAVDTDFRLLSINSSFIRLYQHVSGVIPKIGDPFTASDDEQTQKWHQRFRQCLNYGTLKFEEELTLKGKKTIMEFTATPLHTGGQEASGVSVLGRDITQQKEFEASLQQARLSAEEASRLKSQFIANISHEIRTPMNAIIGFTDLLLQQRLNKLQREYLEIVKVSGESLLELLNDLLDLAKMEAGKQELVLSEFAIRPLVAEVKKAFQAKARMQGLRLTTKIGSSVPSRIVADKSRFRQILNNLVSNAIKFSEKGTVSISINAVNQKSNRPVKLLVEVADQGIGITKEMQEVIFEPFQQLGNRLDKKYSGTGLGLSIARNLVRLMKGELKVDSEPGKGSRFYFTIAVPHAGPGLTRRTAPVTRKSVKR